MEPTPMTNTAKHNSPAGKKIIIINPGSIKKKIVFEEAKALGLRITLVNPGKRTFADPFCEKVISAVDKTPDEVIAQLKHLHQQEPFDGIATFREHDVEATAIIGKELGLLGISPEIATSLRNKFLMRKILEAAGVPAPKAMLVANLEEANQAAKEIGLPLVMKPFKGSDSQGVVKITAMDQIPTCFENIKKYEKPDETLMPGEGQKYVMEEYMSGPELSVEAIIQHGKVHIMAINDKLPMQEPYFIERGHVAPTRHPLDMQEQIKKVATAALEAIGIQDGVTHTEIKVTPTGPKIVEIAGRMGGDCIRLFTKMVYGVNLVHQALLVALGLPIDQERNIAPGTFLRNEYFIPTEDSIFKGIKGIEKKDELKNLALLQLGHHEGDTLLCPPHGFDYAGRMVASGTTQEEVDHNMEELKKVLYGEFEPIK